jgi:nicotinamidase-related amidase
MAIPMYDKKVTAPLVIDPYNDVNSEGGEIWDRIKAVAEANSCIPNMLQVLNARETRGSGIHQLIVIGLIAHTCVEETVRFAAELGYEVTMVKDAIADYSDEEMHAALDVNIPNYASAIVTTNEVIDATSL